MIRRDPIESPRGRVCGLHEMACKLQMAPADRDDMQHLRRRLKHGTEYRGQFPPSHYRHGGCTFHHDRLGKPSQCPRWRHSWIEAPRIAIPALTPP